MKALNSFLNIVGIRTHRSFRLALRLLALLVGPSTAFIANVNFEKNEFRQALYWYIPVGLSAILEFVIAEVLADRSFPFDTERKLALMEQRLGHNVIETIERRINEVKSEFSACDPERISAAVHILTDLAPTEDERFRKGLLQLTSYIGPEGGRKGRVTLTTKGIIGLCARTRRMETVDFATREEYLDSMVRFFGFTSQETLQHTTTARSYLAYPLLDRDSLVGVLYFFAGEPQVFPRAATERRLTELAQEITNYLRISELV